MSALFLLPTCNAKTSSAIFISSSMPAKSLKAWAEDAQTHHIPLVLRGLIGNNLKQTIAFVTTHPALLNSMLQIDPRPYRRCHVTRVPAFCIFDETNLNLSLTPNRSQKPKVAYGDVGFDTLSKSLTQQTDFSIAGQHTIKHLDITLRARHVSKNH